MAEAAQQQSRFFHDINGKPVATTVLDARIIDLEAAIAALLARVTELETKTVKPA